MSDKPAEIDKSAVSEEERIALASKLDKDLDDFIAGLEKRAYTEGWKEDEWEKEMEKHPFFMKDVPQDGEVSPLVEGLQQLKYSPTENSPEELAEAYKEDGNFNFKCKNYRMAIIGYTEGIKQHCSNDSLNAQLYNNRAACHFLLKNYRSCYNDCKLALKLQSDYPKVQKRLAETCKNLKLYDECIEICDQLLKNSNDTSVRTIRTEAQKEKKIKERDERKLKIQEKLESSETEKLRKMIEERGIKFNSRPFWEMEDSGFPHKVKIDENKLVWPVLFLYPEYKTSDLVENFHEDNKFSERLEEVFNEPADWDEERKYTPSSIVLHYEDINGRIHQVKKSTTLKSVLSDPNFRVDGCTPTFFVHAKDSTAYKTFLDQYS